MGCHFPLQGIFLTQGVNPQLGSPELASRFFTTEPPGKPHVPNGGPQICMPMWTRSSQAGCTQVIHTQQWGRLECVMWTSDFSLHPRGCFTQDGGVSQAVGLSVLKPGNTSKLPSASRCSRQQMWFPFLRKISKLTRDHFKENWMTVPLKRTRTPPPLTQWSEPSDSTWPIVFTKRHEFCSATYTGLDRSRRGPFCQDAARRMAPSYQGPSVRSPRSVTPDL